VQSEKTPLSNVFRALHELVDPLVREPLPQGWVELLRRLDEKEPEAPQLATKPRAASDKT
jgi:hypothetical protein